MKLVDVYADEETSVLHLWRLLGEREPHQSISHRQMPTVNQHIGFVRSRPYQGWYLVAVGDETVGAVYLTRQQEVGVGIFKAHQGCGYGKRAVRMLMARFGPGRYLANINPDNTRSLQMFGGLDFKPVQVTLATDFTIDIGPQ